MLIVAAILHKQREDVFMLITCMCLVELTEFSKHSSPSLYFLLRILNARQLLSMTMLLRCSCDALASTTIHRVFEARMVGIQLLAVRQHLVGECVQISNLPWKPRHSAFHRCFSFTRPRTDNFHFVGQCMNLRHGCGNVRVIVG